MDGKLFLGTARFLQSEGGDEAAYRSAISRAYYACFLEARHIIFNNCDNVTRIKGNFRKEKDIRHNNLPRYLKSSPEESIRKLGENLGGLLGKREDADYDMSRFFPIDAAQDAISDAQSFLSDLHNCAPGLLGKALSEYIRKTQG
ncbi:MAG: hypothetical protein HZA50_04530 [Planctomycetes bacterium]|nr:hypothetical protein [Planctomycetota bacterium]